MKNRTLMLCLCMVFLTSAFASGQTTAGSLKGYVQDENGAAIEGATLTLTSDALMGDRTVQSLSRGAYRFINLPPGIYTLTVTKQDYKQFEQQGITISAGKVTGLHVTLKLGDFETVITIQGEAPLIDVESTHQSINVSGELQRILPTTTRNNFSEILRIIPGTTIADPNRPQYSYYQVKGASQYYENNWTIDGAKLNQWEYSYMSARINLDAVEDVEIGLSGGNATMPLGQGGTVYLTTKSGGNEFHGSGYIRYQPTAWNETNVEGGTAKDNDMTEYGFSLGGYIIKDKLWFFGTGRYTTINEGLSRSPTAIARAKAAYPSFSPDLIDKTMKDAFAKATYSPNNDNMLTFSWQQDWGYETFAPWYYDPSAYIDEGTVGPLYNATWNWAVSDDLSVASQISYTNKDRDRFGRSQDQVSVTVYGDSYVSGGNRYGRDVIVTYGNYYGGYGEFQVDEAQLQISSNATNYIDEFYGMHDLKFGFYGKPIAENQFKRFFPTSPLAQYYVLSDPNDPYSDQLLFYQITYHKNEYQFQKVKGKNYAFYVNDVWKPIERLTVEAGLRYDYVGQSDEVQGNEIPVVSLGALSPNIGINYALTEDRKNILRASYSQRHQNVTAYTLPTSEQGLQMGYTEEYDTDLNGTFETVYRQEETYIDPRWSNIEDLSLGYSHDFTFGYSRELPNLMTLNIDYTYRQFRNRIEWYNTNPIIENGVFVGVEDPTFPWGERWVMINNTWNWIEYHSLDVTLNRAFSDNFQFMASYTYEFGSAKGDWSPYDAHYYVSPGKFETYRRSWDDPSDLGHMFRANATYLAPYGITLSTSIQAQGGPRSDYLYETLSDSDPDVTRHGPVWIYQDGYWVYNPLSTTERFPGANRKVDQWRSPMMALINVRIGKMFTYREHKFDVFFDIFNLFNSATSLAPDGRGRYNSTYFEKDDPNYILAPRAMQLMVRYSF